MMPAPQPHKEWAGFGYGLLGVMVFSLTLPATRIAVSGFDPVFVGLGRAIIAAGRYFCWSSPVKPSLR
jgi:hypothetical protein